MATDWQAWHDEQLANMLAAQRRLIDAHKRLAVGASALFLLVEEEGKYADYRMTLVGTRLREELPLIEERLALRWAREAVSCAP